MGNATSTATVLRAMSSVSSRVVSRYSRMRAPSSARFDTITAATNGETPGNAATARITSG